MKLKLSGLCLLLALLLPGAALAQAPAPTIAELTVELWPEFDRPEVLVIHRITLTESTPLPATLTFKFPPYIEAMHAVAAERGGGLFSIQGDALKLNKTDAALELTVTTDSRSLQLEYYDPQILTQQGQQRQIDYNFNADYPVTLAHFQVQQPVQASNFTVTPTASSSFTDQKGLSYQVIETAGLKPGDPLQIKATYTRATNQPSSELLTDNIQVVTQPTPTAAPQFPWGYLLIGAGVVVLLATGGYWWWANRAAAPPAPKPGTPKKRPAGRVVKPGRPGGYCHQCGAALRPDSNFCHACGAPRRKD